MSDGTEMNQKRSVRGMTILLISLLALSSALLVIVISWPHLYRSSVYGGMTGELKDCELYEDMQSGRSFCFLGDSITEGSLVWNIPWYRPLEPYIKGKVMNYSRGGWESGDLLADDIPAADIYVVAIGVNDVWVPHEDHAASNAVEFADNIAQLSDIIEGISPGAKMYLIAPWPFLNQPRDTDLRHDSYTAALEEWCNGTDRIFIDPTGVILSVIGEGEQYDYMIDNVHPNIEKGIGLYSYAVLYSDHMRRNSL